MREFNTPGPDERDALPHPMQPLHLDAHGVIRFKRNKIVRDLLDHCRKHGFNLNDVAERVCEGAYSVEDYEQLMQLIGYSLGGFEELSMVREETKDKAGAAAVTASTAAVTAASTDDNVRPSEAKP